MTTIQEVAQRAGTSIATVSHVIHHTRFVSEPLRQKVLEAMEELGYEPEESGKIIVGFLLRNYRCSFAEDLIDALNYYYCDRNVEVAAILVPSEITLQELKTYYKRYHLDFAILDYTVQLKKTRQHRELERPIIFLNHDPEEYPLCYHINFDYHAAMVQALRHLLSLGHKQILIISPVDNPYTNRVALETCRQVYEQYGMKFSPENVLLLDTYQRRHVVLPVLEKEFERRPQITGIITTEMMATMHVVDYLRTQGISTPQDMSLLAIGDIFLTKYLFFNRTRIDMRIPDVRMDIEKIIFHEAEKKFYNILPDFITGDSTKALVYDQFDRTGGSPLLMVLSEADIQRVRAGNFKVCVSLFTGSTPFSISQMEGLRDGLNTLGIHLIQQTDAHGSYEIQNLHLQGFREAKPDAVICIPNMDENEVEPFRNSFPRKTHHLFSSCVPEKFTQNQYDTCITNNAVESGKQASKLLGKYMVEHGLTHAAFLCVGRSSMPANRRDQSAINIIREEFPTVKLDHIVYYKDDSQIYTLVSDLLAAHPEIEAMYISQSRVTEAVLGILALLKRTDIKIVTQGVSKAVIDQLDKHLNVVGVVCPNSYEIGRLLAYASAHFFLGQEQAPYVAVDPVAFTPQNLSSAWLSVMKNKLT